MAQSTIALIITAVVIVLFVTKLIPVPVTAMLGAFAMYLTGITTYQDAIAGFTSSSVQLIIGLMIIGYAFDRVGLADRIGDIALRFSRGSERVFVFVVMLLAVISSMFFVSIAALAILMRVIDSVAVSSEGRISRKASYLPLAIAANYGGMITIITTTTMNAGNILQQSGYDRVFTYFEPGILGVPINLAMLAIAFFFGHALSEKIFTFEEIPPVHAEGFDSHKDIFVPKWHVWAAGLITLLVIFGSVFNLMPIGALAMLGALALMALRVVRPAEAFANVQWNVIFLIVGALGLAKGIFVSGAGEVLATTAIGLLGPWGSNPYIMCMACVLLCGFITNFVSDNGTVTIMAPIAISIAMQLGADPLPFALAIGVTTNLSIQTPVGCASLAMVEPVGYRFTDYVRYGALYNLAAVIICAIVLKVVYF